jgi:citrate synthase
MSRRTLTGDREAGYLTAAETAHRLGIKQATLYSYVSRGLLQAHRPRDGRTSLFHPEEVERLRTRPGRGARPELSIPSAVTLLRPDGLYYRGVDAILLAATRSYEQAAALLWHGSSQDSHPWHAPDAAIQAGAAAQRALTHDPLPLERLQAAVAAIATTDPLRFDVTPAAVRRLAPGLITSMVASLHPSSQEPDTRLQGTTATRSLACNLAAQLSGKPPAAALTRVLNATLVLLADHELAASTVAVRIAAATRSPVYACVAAGLGVLQGPLHGGTSLRAEDLLAQIQSPAKAEAVIRAHLSRGDPLWGFGHPLYENGDPRAAMLLPLILGSAPARKRKTVEALLAFAAGNSLAPPTIDLALGALAHCWSLTRGSGQAIFAISRTAGWIAHAIEEYERKASYRIRAAYTGPPPQPTQHLAAT